MPDATAQSSLTAHMSAGLDSKGLVPPTESPSPFPATAGF